jgi:dihydrofolate reductase
LAKVIVGMTISLDGFVADQNGNAGRLYPDLAALRHTAYLKDAIEQTGAVLMGRRTFEMGDPDSYVGNYEFQVPIFDELHVDIMPVFLGIGLRSFKSSSLESVRLEKINVQEVGARTSLRFRVK